MIDQRARALIARYDLVDVTRCGEGWREMQRDDQYGDWVSYEDHMAALADERRRADEEAKRLRECLGEVNRVLQDPESTGISDTIWYNDLITLVEFTLHVAESLGAQKGVCK